MIILPGPEKSVTVKISLKTIEEIEAEYGSLYQMAESLLDKSLPLTAVIGVLNILYSHAGCEISDDFILQQPCTDLLASVLLDILSPIDSLSEPPSCPAPHFLTEMMHKFPDR